MSHDPSACSDTRTERRHAQKTVELRRDGIHPADNLLGAHSDHAGSPGVPVFHFVTCPFCSGHEAIGQETAEELRWIIECWLAEEGSDNPELENILNMLRNFQERGICPGTNNEPTNEDLLS